MLSNADRSISDVANAMARHGVEATYLVPTETGLAKAIMDAIAPLRSYLKRELFHDFDKQPQGQEHKRVLDAYLVHSKGLSKTKVSLYRPEAKQGDPRIWIYGLAEYAKPGNVLALFVLDGALYVINASDPSLFSAVQPTAPIHASDGAVDLFGYFDAKSSTGELPLAARKGSPILELLQRKANAGKAVSMELLGMLREVAKKGYIPSVRVGDTGVGATLEAELGIATNSSRKPDYKGIEIKASRRHATKGARNRVTLFSQVPNWNLSQCRNGSAILASHGYAQDGRLQLYCTVANTPNSQGLFLTVNESKDWLESLCKRAGSEEKVCLWMLESLRDRLQEKHRETFWVKALARGQRGSTEEFSYVAVEHTRAPLVTNLEPLLSDGKITFDFTISHKPSGGVRDHGYLFKIWPKDFPSLFPPSQSYSLT